jgi:hypothetical protein
MQAAPSWPNGRRCAGMWLVTTPDNAPCIHEPQTMLKTTELVDYNANSRMPPRITQQLLADKPLDPRNTHNRQENPTYHPRADPDNSQIGRNTKSCIGLEHAQLRGRSGAACVELPRCRERSADWQSRISLDILHIIGLA